ncbi:hypothetical protein RB195_025186 [Necator americanus]|uniref:Uncharacterized protein n=1 Tax=Necator americanus TaxID=51031 RepID=A0ABR1ETC7_NECAM
MDDRWVHNKTNTAYILRRNLFSTNDECTVVHLFQTEHPAMASLAFTTGRRPTYMDHGATLRHIAKNVVDVSSGLLLVRLPIRRSWIVGCAQLLSLEDPVGGRDSAAHGSSTPRITSKPL